jgi:hypothetical protein
MTVTYKVRRKDEKGVAVGSTLRETVMREAIRALPMTAGGREVIAGEAGAAIAREGGTVRMAVRIPKTLHTIISANCPT